MSKIHPSLHREILNRRLIKASVNNYEVSKGLKSTKGDASKDMIMINELEDEALIKLKTMAQENQYRENEPMNDSQARHQLLTMERIYGALARSSVGPALLYQIEKRIEFAGNALKDMDVLDDKINNPLKYEN